MVIKQKITKVWMGFVTVVLLVLMAGVVAFAQDEVYEENTEYDPITIRFDTGGGSEIADQEISRYGSPTRPEDPTKEGYRFVGWFVGAKEEEEFDFNESYSSDTTAYARWEEIEYIYVNFMGASEGYFDRQKLEAGVDKPTVPEDNPIGYDAVFDGWYADAECTIPFDFDATYTEDTVVYAKWIEYEVKVEKIEGVYTAVVFPETAESDVTSYQWYGLEGNNWEPIEGATEKTFSAGQSNGMYYCEVTFAGITSPLPSQDIEYIKTYFLTMVFPTYTSKVPVDEGKSFTQSYPGVDYSDISKAHHTFLGWYRSDDEGQTFDATEFDFSQAINEHITIYSRFEIDKHKVTYKADGVIVDEILVPHGSDATAPSIPAKDGYTAVWDNDGTVINGDRTINAVYTLIQTPGGNGSTEDTSEDTSEDSSKDDNNANNNNANNNNANNNNANSNNSLGNNFADGNLGVTGIVGWIMIAVAGICVVSVGVLLYSKKKEC